MMKTGAGEFDSPRLYRESLPIGAVRSPPDKEIHDQGWPKMTKMVSLRRTGETPVPPRKC